MWIYGGGIEKAYIITPEEAVKAVEVANAMPVKSSIKVIPNNIPCFLLIVTELFILGLFYLCLSKIFKRELLMLTVVVKNG